MLKLFALPSRWKYVTFTSGAVFVQQSCEALSPALVFGLWKALGFDLSLCQHGQSGVLAVPWLATRGA